MGFRVMPTRFAMLTTTQVCQKCMCTLHFEIWQTVMLIVQRWATFPADLFVAPFSVNRQQDAAKFLEALAMFCAPLRNCLDYTIRTYLRCSNCSYTGRSDERSTVLPLVILADLTTVRLHELFSKLNNWETML